jgi:acyl-coenzyme A synthetase/AMP-(fatty) acid ligase
MFNAAAYFVDRHIEEAHEASIAIECGDRRLTYGDLFDRVNRVGNALKSLLDVRPEERVLLVMCDGPEIIAAFFGTIKIGAIPVPRTELDALPGRCRSRRWSPPRHRR